MLLVDARRLTGPNLLSRSPQVVVELTLEAEAGDTLDSACAVYLEELGRMRGALGYPPHIDRIIRPHRGGLVIAHEPPSVDLLLPHAEMAEWAALSGIEILGGRARLSLEPKRSEIEAMIARDRSPRFCAITEEARTRDLPCLWDDTEVTVGAGERSMTWPRDALPEAADIPWSTLGRIPIALITGTNGKTTSTRLLARIASEAGRRVGCASSDAIQIGTETIEDGDWTGPAAARIVLRRKDVDFAVLETARGGILRRGLAIETCDAALITNVSEDHTGGYGIDDLEAMTRVKAVVTNAVRIRHSSGGGAVVLNARDSKLVELVAPHHPPEDVIFFADLDGRSEDQPDMAVIGEAKRAVYTEYEAIWSRNGNDVPKRIIDVADIPITFSGAARYNVENALGVVAMAQALGFTNEAIARGLRSFQPNDNPRRGEIVERNGVRVLLDFGHNPEGVRAVMRLVASLRAAGEKEEGKLTVVAGAAGDRSDHEVREMSRVISESGVDRIFVRDLVDYLRGRAPGEMPALFHRELIALGVADASITTVSSETEALRQTFEAAKPGDFVVVLVHLDRDEVHAFLTTV